jgi:hypothetical protein
MNYMKLLKWIASGKASLGKLTTDEILIAWNLGDLGLIKFDRTAQGNLSKKLVITELGSEVIDAPRNF